MNVARPGHDASEAVMKNRIIAACVTMLFVAEALPAQALNRDVRCLMASNVFAQAEKDAQRRQIALGAHFFYLGRLDGRLNPAQLKAQILAQGRTLTKDNLAQTMNDCAKTVQTKELAVAELGRELTKQTAR
jgi:hypothetical protein